MATVREIFGVGLTGLGAAMVIAGGVGTVIYTNEMMDIAAGNNDWDNRNTCLGHQMDWQEMGRPKGDFTTLKINNDALGRCQQDEKQIDNDANKNMQFFSYSTMVLGFAFAAGGAGVLSIRRKDDVEVKPGLSPTTP